MYELGTDEKTTRPNGPVISLVVAKKRHYTGQSYEVRSLRTVSERQYSFFVRIEFAGRVKAFHGSKPG